MKVDKEEGRGEEWKWKNIEKALVCRYVVGFIHQLLFRFQANYSSFRLWCKMILIVADMVERTGIVFRTAILLLSHFIPPIIPPYNNWSISHSGSGPSVQETVSGSKSSIMKVHFLLFSFTHFPSGWWIKESDGRWDQDRTRGERKRVRESIERELFFSYFLCREKYTVAQNAFVTFFENRMFYSSLSWIESARPRRKLWPFSMTPL